MFKLVLLASFVACALGAAIPDGLLPQLDGRIVGGQETTIDRFPYQISLQKNGAHSCGGSVYNEQYILTAAHCLVNVSPNVLKIRAGSSSRNSGGVLINIEEVIVHPGFSFGTMENDIALLKLATSLTYGPTIKAIKPVKETPVEGTRAVVSGWGTERSGAFSSPTILRFVNLKIVSKKVCSSKTFSYGSDIKSKMICAAAAGKDSCQGDSGGPLVVEDGQAGVVSWGYGCAASEYPGVYTNVADFSSWILENVATL